MTDPMDSLIQPMADLMHLHKKIGSFYAQINWFKCYDLNHSTEQYAFAKAQIRSITSQIDILKGHFSFSLNEEEFETLVSECQQSMESYKEAIEREIEMKYRPSGVHFNKNALIILTKNPIPEDIKIGLSFGYKFLFPYYCNDSNMHRILAQLEMTIEDSIYDLQQLEASVEIFHILKQRDPFQKDDNIKWLKFVSNRTKTFFESHPHIFATRSDKGGHTVIIDTEEYDNKLGSLLNDDEYLALDHDPLQGLITKEGHLIEMLKGDEKTKKLLKDLPPYEPNTHSLPKFYGLPKIHKKDTPLRPITATVGCVGYLTAKVFDKMLARVFPRTKHHIKDSYDFVKFLDNIRVAGSDILVSFDVVSMFSSIPFDLVHDIVIRKANDFELLFSINKDTLETILNFLLQECMVFTALNNTYKQKDGLPMGSCISPSLARIVMDEIVNKLLESIPQISFIKVFVDDTIAAMNKSQVATAMQILNGFRPGQIKFTHELENDLKSLNFLNVTLTRKRGGIITNWYRKSFASGRLVNYYSSHKRTTVMSTAAHFIRTVLLLSDAQFFHNNKDIVISTLRENSFPETTIIALMNNFYTYMKPIGKTSVKIEKVDINIPDILEVPDHKKVSQSTTTPDDDIKSGYVIFPHSICKGRSIKKVLCNLKASGVILADSVRNTKVNSITSRKTITSIRKRKNLILISQCQCKKRYKVVRTGFNETGEITERKVVTNKKRCDEHSHAYRKVQFHKGLNYSSQTRYLLKYIQYKYRNRLDVFSCRFEMPNFHLSKLIKVGPIPT